MIDEVNEAIHEAKNMTVFPMEMVGTKEAVNKLLDDFAEVGFIKDEQKPLDGDYVKAFEPEMVDGIIGNYRAIPIRVIDAPPSFDKDQIVVREKKSFKVLYTTEGEGKE